MSDSCLFFTDIYIYISYHPLFLPFSLQSASRFYTVAGRQERGIQLRSLSLLTKGFILPHFRKALIYKSSIESLDASQCKYSNSI